MNKEKSDPIISETLDVIRKALENENQNDINENSSSNEILLLNKIVQNDGTILTIKDEKLKKEEIKDIKINEVFEKNIEKIFDKHFKKWLDNKLPTIINNYLKNKH